MAKWTAFPYKAADYAYSSATLKKHWARLHAGDAEPWPADAKVLDAWILFHAGEFQKACDAGLKAGGAGVTVANKAQCIYANYLERSAKARLELFLDAAARAEAQQSTDADNPNAWYWQAYAIGRYSQSINVARALSQGLGSKVRTALEKTIALAPQHADAHVALGTFHAEVIDTLGRLLGLAQGANATTGLQMFRQALKLNPNSVIGKVEYANGLVMLEGDKYMAEAEALYVDAAQTKPIDATERLSVEMAKAELDD